MGGRSRLPDSESSGEQRRRGRIPEGPGAAVRRGGGEVGVVPGRRLPSPPVPPWRGCARDGPRSLPPARAAGPAAFDRSAGKTRLPRPGLAPLPPPAAAAAAAPHPPGRGGGAGPAPAPLLAAAAAGGVLGNGG